ncbi:MAG: hypothetical protein PHD82_11555 [Candidatus Riflebacteria bacterium]|nr:hypothetical protein [Candidatus Riflebacteria bacterium]
MFKQIFVAVGIAIIIAAYATAATLPAGATTVRSIAVEGNGRIWVATFGNGLWVVDETGPRRFTDSKTDQPFPMINNLLLSGNRLFIATAGGGCVALNTTTLQFEKITQARGFEKLHALTRAADGSIYIGSVGSGSAVLQNDAWQPLTQKESSQLSWVNSIVEWQGYLWLGTATGLYRNKSGSPWKPSAGELRRAINCLHVHENTLYAGTTDRGVYAIKPDDYPVQVSQTLGPINFLTSYDGQVLAGGNMGLWSIKNAQASEITSGIVDPKCVFADDKKNLLIGTLDGKIYVSNDGTLFRLKLTFKENGLEEHKP